MMLKTITLVILLIGALSYDGNYTKCVDMTDYYDYREYRGTVECDGKCFTAYPTPDSTLYSCGDCDDADLHIELCCDGDYCTTGGDPEPISGSGYLHMTLTVLLPAAFFCLNFA